MLSRSDKSTLAGILVAGSFTIRATHYLNLAAVRTRKFHKIAFGNDVYTTATALQHLNTIL
jgi:hypothetical protein